jgi:hypothetical protein
MALISQSDIEARLGRSLTAEETTTFTIVNNALQSKVEQMIGSDVESVSETTRYYDGGVQHLPINPCTNITSVKLVDDDQVATDTYDTTDYTTEPINKTLKTMLRHRSGAFSIGINNIAIAAKFSIYGDTDTLNIVKDAMINALVSEVNNSDNIKRESIEGYSIEYATTETKNSLASIKYLFPEI